MGADPVNAGPGRGRSAANDFSIHPPKMKSTHSDHFVVSRNRSVLPKCPARNPLRHKRSSASRTLGHYARGNSFMISCVRVGACGRVRARIYIHTYIVSLVSLCPKPYGDKGLRAGHIRDTTILVSCQGREASLS